MSASETAAQAAIDHGLELRFVDEQGKPVADVAVCLSNDLESPVARSNQNGEVHVIVPLQEAHDARRSFGLEALHPRFANLKFSAPLVAGSKVWLGDLTLFPGGSVQGRLPVPMGAELRLSLRPTSNSNPRGRRLMPPNARPTYASSQADGSFRIDGIAPGDYKLLTLSREDYLWVSESFSVVAGGLTQVKESTFASRVPEDSIQGRVLGPNGEPVPGAQLGWAGYDYKDRVSWLKPGATEVAADGSFAIELKRSSKRHLVAWSTQLGYGRVELEEVQPGARGIEMRLPLAEALKVHVIDEQGLPVAATPLSVYVAVGAELNDKGRPKKVTRERNFEYADLVTDAEGSVSLTEPAQRYLLLVSPEGFFGSSGYLSPGEAKEVIEIQLAPQSEQLKRAKSKKNLALRGRVTLHGEPVKGAQITLHNASPPGLHKRAYVGRHRYRSIARHRMVGPSKAHSILELGRTQLQAQPFAMLCRAAPDREQLTSDERGEFFTWVRSRSGYDSGEWRMLQASWNGHVSQLIGPFPRDTFHRDGWVPLEIELAATGAIAGQVFAPPGTKVSGLVVGASRGDGLCRSTSVAPDGSYRIDGLAPGDWQVRVCPRSQARIFDLHAESKDRFRERQELQWDCVVQSGADSHYDLDLKQQSAVRLAGRVEIDGVDAAGWHVRVLSRESPGSEYSPSLSSTYVQSNNSFDIELYSALPVWLEFAAPDQAFVHWMPVDLLPGNNSVTLRLKMGELSYLPKPAERVVARWGDADGAHGEWRPANRVDADSPRKNALPAGGIRLIYSPLTNNCYSLLPNEFLLEQPISEFEVQRLARRTEEQVEMEKQARALYAERQIAEVELKPGESLFINLRDPKKEIP